jgi:hypothetical protein
VRAAASGLLKRRSLKYLIVPRLAHLSQRSWQLLGHSYLIGAKPAARDIVPIETAAGPSIRILDFEAPAIRADLVFDYSDGHISLTSIPLSGTAFVG